ncbi:2-5A-dependent ribonuclease [Sorex fumeus]|uniref:2-5A-dependent ribonuclease n=1 Tax=Sorex fumeus TaxID=62283 RepID=UPI0024AD38C0|nr:2-5A-dependent ribonuclease [Sorex fumeus]
MSTRDGGAGAAEHALFNAVLQEDVEQVKRLLEAGASVNAQEAEGGWAPLHAAVQNCHEELVHLLLAHGADPLQCKRNGATPFILAGIMGHVGLLDLFLSRGAQVDECDHNGFTALAEAATYGHVDAVRFLHARGADVNLRQRSREEQARMRKGGSTALMRAAERGHEATVRALLLELHADASARDNCGRNALVYALRHRDEARVLRIARLLLAQGADVRVRCERGKTPLLLALEQRHERVAQMLLAQPDIELDATDRELNTALLVAVRLELNDVVDQLCARGANTDCGDLVMMARRKYNRALVQILRRHRVREDFQLPAADWKPQSARWGRALTHLHGTYRPLIRGLKVFIDREYKIADTSEGGVYLGFYQGREVAVKRFYQGSEPGQREVACLQRHREPGHLVTFYESQEDSGCVFVCLALYEHSLEEYLQKAPGQGPGQGEDEFARSVCASVFKGVLQLHRSGYAHQDLHPSNVLLDSKRAAWLADFDKSTEKAGDEEIRADLKALGLLVLYLARKGDVSWEKLKAKSQEEQEALCPDADSLDLLQCLLQPQGEATELLPQLLGHPFFWSWEKRYRALRDVGNESDIKVQKRQSLLFELLESDTSRHSRSFAEWNKKIDEPVMKKMEEFYKRNSKRKKKCPHYENTVVGLLKFIRNIGAHVDDKVNEDMKSIIGEPSHYFQKKFPDLFIYVYRKLRDEPYNQHFEKNSPAQPASG